MAFDDAPLGFFGPGYALTSSEIKLPTADFADISIAAFTTAFATNNNLTFAAYHNLKVGDKISLTTSTTLPAPLAISTDYFVKTASGPSDTPHVITLSSSLGGTVITLTDDGTGTHTAHALAPLREVTDAEANASTGDWRKVIYGIMELLHLKYANTASGDRPANVVIAKSESRNTTTGVTTNSYSVVIKTLTSASEVMPE